MDQEILGNQDSFKSSQIGIAIRPIMRVNQSISQGEEILMEKTPRDDEPLLGMIGNEQNDDELVAELRQ